jgi:hypothetical protein
MIKELIKLANELDGNGHRDLASKLDSILVQNKGELNKFAIAVEIPAEEAMAHEEHSPFEESSEYEAERNSEEFKKIEMAERVAELVVGGTPVFGIDPETGRRAEDDMAQELAEVLSQDQHAETVSAILRFIDGEQ